MKGWILHKKRKYELDEEDYSALRLLEAAKAKGVDLELYNPDQFDLVVTRNDAGSIVVDGMLKALPDFIIPRMGSATTYFALAIIRQLERLGVHSFNSAAAVEIVRDKMRTHQLLAQSNLPTPKTMLLKFPTEIRVIKREIGFPVVIKNITGTAGAGIYLCNSESEFTDLMELLYSNNSSANIILQEFVAPSKGKDLRVFVLGGKVIGIMKRTSQNSFKANFSRGGNVEPFKLIPEVEWLAIEAARLVDLEVAGIDLLFDINGYKVCEANSSPGFKGLEKVVGKNIAEQIIDYVAIKTNASIKS